MRICILDPALWEHDGEPSPNLGDLIIKDAVDRVLGELFPGAQIDRVSSHKPLGRREIGIVRRSDVLIAAGTNMISSDMLRRIRPWKTDLLTAQLMPKVTLLAVGWWRYQGKIDLYTRLLYRKLFSRDGFHSVRDAYTKEKLEGIGHRNVLNTSCVTLWQLGEDDYQPPPQTKADRVLTTLTDYRRDADNDRALLDLLARQYDEVHCWPQGTKDREYVGSLGVPVRFVERTMAGLDGLFASDGALDYVGTRLHCGIRALQFSRRSLIVEVDNRAAEIARDTGLQTVARGDIDATDSWIKRSPALSISLDEQAIAQWKGQFAGKSLA